MRPRSSRPCCRRRSGRGRGSKWSARRCRAGRLAGTSSTTCRCPNGDCAFAVADVSGKGAPAALLTAVIQGILASNSSIGGGPSTTLDRVNQVLISRHIEARFATIFYGTLSREGCLTYTNAGHNPPFLVQRSGIKRLETGGTIVGLFAQARYDEEVIALEAGDLGHRVQRRRVRGDGSVRRGVRRRSDPSGCIQKNPSGSPERLLECLLASVKAFCAGALQSDDVTALIMRYDG